MSKRGEYVHKAGLHINTYIHKTVNIFFEFIKKQTSIVFIMLYHLVRNIVQTFPFPSCSPGVHSVWGRQIYIYVYIFIYNSVQ